MHACNIYVNKRLNASEDNGSEIRQVMLGERPFFRRNEINNQREH